MNIGIIIGRIGGVDGVALETEKWIEVLERMGHKVFVLSGQFQERKMNEECEDLVQEMSFFSPESYWEQKKAFFQPDSNLDELMEHILFYGKIIKDKIIQWVYKRKIDLIISENASAYPSHLSMGQGTRDAFKELGIPVITHDHDFAWERGERFVSIHDEINDFVERIFPLRLPNSIHAVINSNAQDTIKQKYGRESVNVPNVMDFDEPYGVLTNDNIKLRNELGLNKEDIPLFQITRIVRRKAIEVAIKLIHELDDKRIKLIITGSATDDEGSVYYNELVEQIFDLNLRTQVKFASNLIKNHEKKGQESGLIYTLSDAYAIARGCTYFSTYEGFGNAFVESVLSKTPIFVNDYKPVYTPDIGSKGFKTVMLNDNELTPEAIEEMQEIIFNDNLNKEIGEYNFELGKKYFSYDTLEQKLQELIEKAGKI